MCSLTMVGGDDRGNHAAAKAFSRKANSPDGLRIAYTHMDQSKEMRIYGVGI